MRMSFDKFSATIKEGDLVVLHLGQDHFVSQVVEPGYTYQTRFGALHHSQLIGRRFGCRVSTSKGFVHVLHPTPELWTLCLPHRTQILYSTDISVIIYQLDLKPGSVVCEAGTGSGSLSHALLRTIKPRGHLHTYEFHEERMRRASEEFESHGLTSCVSVSCRDVCSDGYPLADDSVDGVFLDLPKPWEALGDARRILKNLGRICSFSPCVEQSQKVVVELSRLHFGDVVTVECLPRVLDVKLTSLPVPRLSPLDGGSSCAKQALTLHTCTAPTTQTGHTGYLTFATKFS